MLYAFSCGVLFSYISSASFIIQNEFGFSELQFSIVFGVNAVGIGIGSALSLKFRKMQNAALFGAAGITACSVAQAAATLISASFWPYEAFTLLMLTCLGFILTSSTALAMDEGRQMVGSASAIFGASGFLFGGIVTPIVGLGDIMATSELLLISCSAISLLFALVALRRKTTTI